MGVGFAALFAVAVVAAVIALDQRSEAQKQAKTSLTRQLAATSDSLAERDLDVSLLMAVQAYENEPNAAALGALIQANTASPKLVRFLHTGSTVAQIAASGDGKTGVAGLDDGRVVRFPVREAGGEVEEVMDLGAAITSLAVSRDGATIAASDGEGAFVSSGGQDGGEQTELVITEGLLADVVGLSPSGDVVVVHGNPDAIDAEESVWSFDTTGDELHAPIGLGELTTVSTIIARSDSDITIFTGYGEWQERHSPTRSSARATSSASARSGRDTRLTARSGPSPEASSRLACGRSAGRPTSRTPSTRPRSVEATSSALTELAGAASPPPTPESSTWRGRAAE